MSSTDLLDAFIQRYELGEMLTAEQLLIATPSIPYDSLNSNEPLFHYIVNYVDACIFKGQAEYRLCAKVLKHLFETDPIKQLIHADFIRMLHKEFILFSCFESVQQMQMDEEMAEFFSLFHENALKHSQRLQNLVLIFPETLQPIVKNRLKVAEALILLKENKPKFWSFFIDEEGLTKQPWHSFQYDFTLQFTNDLEPNELPLIFFQPHPEVCSFLLKQITPFILVFENKTHFFQMLQFKELASLLIHPEIIFYILDEYPTAQLNVQHAHKLKEKQLKIVEFTQSSYSTTVLSTFKDALTTCLNLISEEIQKENKQSNLLYALTKEMLNHSETLRYGKSRCIAHHIECGFFKWHDIHKESHQHWQKTDPDYFAERLQELAVKRSINSFNHPKIRLVHIVPQIIDDGHAPTKLLKVLCKEANRDQFDLFVISTEKACYHPLSYPIVTYLSEASEKRGKKSIEWFAGHNIPVMLAQESPSYESTVEFIEKKCQELQADIAVFHGPDELNTMIACSTSTSQRVLFEHGTLPDYLYFDKIILSSQEARDRLHKKFHLEESQTAFLDFSLDVKSEWKEHPHPKEDLGLPENAFIMTTISNHLDHRLSIEMCHAIGEILKRCSNAVYAPMGTVSNEMQKRVIFEEYGVNNRVIFLGNIKNPGQYVRSMQLYLNEFPFGSCIGILEALASGCPIVSMYDENGPQQGRYGGTYFGKDWVIQSGNVKEYVELAYQLISNPDMYSIWSKHALEAYEKHANLKEYVNGFESFIYG